jgi:UDP-N-acetyl-D-mannosaminuronic acid dehydrogenase
MSFKDESDDIRDSLSYKIKRLMEYEVENVYCSDEYIKDPNFISFKELLKKSDLIIIGAPHEKYRSISTSKPVIDIWNLLGKGINI